MPSSPLLKATGLNISTNPLEVPPGSLVEANNIIIKRNDIIESRRGYKIYDNGFGGPGDTAKQLMTYKNRILVHYSNSLAFDNGSTLNGLANLSNFNGTFTETQTGLRMKSIESNGNFYFTTSAGIKKISATSASEFSTSSGYVTQAGGVKALDFTTSVNYTPGNITGFFTQDAAVAYRVVWGTKDKNNNLILGTPSQRAVVYNSLLTTLLEDFTVLLGALDNISQPGSLINDGTYVSTLKLPLSASAAQLQLNLIALTAKIDNDILYAGGGGPLTISSVAESNPGVATITFSVGNPQNYWTIGQRVTLAGFTPTVGTTVINGSHVITAVTATTINISVTGTVAGDTWNTVGTINSNDFSFITQPGTPSTPATDQQLVALQTYINNILAQLRAEPNAVISTTLLNTYIVPLATTTTSTVSLTVTIPQNIDGTYFVQIYRSPQAIATGASVLSTDVSPSDELQQVYEAYPTATEIAAGQMTIVDITPDSFLGAYLYTNAATGQGILQSNDVPPFARDINRFKNVIFYASTKTKHSKLVNLLGISNIILDYNNGKNPAITIANQNGVFNTYKFVLGVQQVTQVTTVADIAGSLGGKYFTINSGNDKHAYYVWFSTGVSIDPAVANRTGIKVNIVAGDTANTIATKLSNTLSQYPGDFVIGVSTNVVTVTNVDQGYSVNATAGTSGFTVTVTVSGKGEQASTNSVLLSSSTSPSQAVDQTARSLVRIINKNTNEGIYAYYLSGANDVPGKMQFEARSLNTQPFYIISNSSNVGTSFNPNISPVLTINSIVASGGAALVTTTTPHGLTNLDNVIITDSNSTASIDGYHQITYINTTQFTIPITITVSGNYGALSKDALTVVTTNDDKPNRIYYSKIYQPEAVPLTNYFDVGAQDKAILRIIPLRDTLFVFKEDGLFRISGEVAPFSLSLFDSSCDLIAPDTLSIANNIIYGWTTQGISTITESGVVTVSRPIDIDILKLASSSYTNFNTAAWGIGYDADNSYTVYTVKNPTDTVAKIAYRYSNLTNSWTTFDLSKTCGVVNTYDSKQYLGASDTNHIEQERKLFDRTDYADREHTLSLTSGNYFGTRLKFSDVSMVTVGDALVQNQTLSPYIYNMLLQKLDIDPGCGLHNYFVSLQSVAGDDMRAKLLALTAKLDTDPTFGFTNYTSTINTKSGSITSNTSVTNTVITSANHGLLTGRLISISGSNCVPSIDGISVVTVIDANTFSIPIAVITPGTAGTWSTVDTDFADIQTCYNAVISKLNLDTGPSFSNYQQIMSITSIEAIVTAVDPVTKYITLNNTLNFVQGNIIDYAGIVTRFTYAPNHFGDPLSFKHFREASIMFLSKNFTSAIARFSTDLLPSFVVVPFNGDGNGVFGSGNFGSGFFGGGSHPIPFRTFIPRQCQRCRFITLQFEHNVAREQYGITGITLTGDAYSTRAYR